MLVAIDYDGTWAAMPDVFRKFVESLRAAGHEAICVTGRIDSGIMGDVVRSSINGLMPIVFAGSKWKVDAAKEAGYNVDIWIDDNPSMIAPQIIVGGGWSSD